jgi:hypothetical protein
MNGRLKGGMIVRRIILVNWEKNGLKKN